MNSKINIIVEKNAAGYRVSFPELADQPFQDESLEVIIHRLKETLSQQLDPSEVIEPPTTGQSILNIVQKFTADMTVDEITQLPTDAAAQHDHYLYGTPKRDV